MTRWLSYLGAGVLAVTVAAVSATSCAASARADETDYLSELQDRFAFASKQQLLTEGRKICAGVNGGQSGVDTVAMVVKDLGVSESEAIETMTAAITKLKC